MLEVIQFMKTNKFDIIYLGSSPFRSTRDFTWPGPYIFAQKVSKHIIKYAGNLAHAYIVSRIAMKQILAEYEKLTSWNKFVHIDAWYTKIFDNSYCVVPILFDQRFCLPSNNTPVDQIETIARHIQCSAEHYKIFFWLSMLPYYRLEIAIVLGIIFVSLSLFKQ